MKEHKQLKYDKAYLRIAKDCLIVSVNKLAQLLLKIE
jgi:hypothetical protein